MELNVYAIIIILTLVGEYLLGLWADRLNLHTLGEGLPREFADACDANAYARSQEYTRTTTRFAMLRTSVMLFLILAFWSLGGFAALDAATTAAPRRTPRMLIAAATTMAIAAT